MHVTTACWPSPLAAGAGAAHAQGKTELQWFSQAAFKLTTPGGKVIMIDPWIMGATRPPRTQGSRQARQGRSHPGHPRPRRPPGRRDGDRQDQQRADLGPAGMNQSLATLGVMPANLVPRMNKGGTIEPVPRREDHQVHAEHSSEMILKDPATGKNTSYPAGEPVGFIIQLENGFKIYHMGDTGAVRRHEADRRVLQARPAADPDRRPLRDGPRRTPPSPPGS